MAELWVSKDIQDVYLGLYDGPHATPKPSRLGPIFLGIKNLTIDGRLDLRDIRNISEEDFPDWTKRVLPQAGDIVFSYEATLNLYARIPEGFRGCLGRRLALIRPNPDQVDPVFLFYYFFGDEWRRTIAQNINIGSTVDRIPLIEFPRFKIRVPSISTQSKIASILSAYDDLIENNLRRVKILDEMAQLLYREWFVNFRFPGHEKGKWVDSSIGKIPQGWQAVPIGGLFTTVLGGTPARERPEYWEDGTIPWINSSKANEIRVIDATEFITKQGLEHSSSKLMPKGTTILAITGATLGQVSYLELEVCANQSVVGIIDSSRQYSEYIYLKTKEIIRELINQASGGAQQHINKELVNAFKIVLPPLSLVLQFSDLAKPIFDLIAGNLRQNRLLRQTRDLLLPKLISGQLDVANLDIQVSGDLR